MTKVKKKIGLIVMVIFLLFLLFHTVGLFKLFAGRLLHPGLQAASNPLYPAACLRQDSGASVGVDDTSISDLLPFSFPVDGLPPAIGRTELIGREAEQNIPPHRDAGGLVVRDTARPQNDWLDELIEKIWFIESGGRTDCPDGDGGDAIGPLQIHPCVLEDINRRYGTNFVCEELRNIESAKIVARLYIWMWMDIHKEEIAARIFNGGPRGWQKKSTDAYWKKIQLEK